MNDQEIVGHKTLRDENGRRYHEPLTRGEVDAILAANDEAKAKRAELMPDEESAIRMMREAHQRLKELGWREAVYCPKDGSTFSAIEPGSSGIHACHYTGDWPKGSWWVHADGDLWPSRPILWKPMQHQEEQDNGN